MRAGKDLEMLTALAELRLATTSQLAAWLPSSERIVRRRAARLVQMGLAQSLPGTPARGRGRPQWTYAVTGRGVAALQQSRVLPATLSPDRITADALLRMMEHQLLLNEVALQCRDLERSAAGFQVRFIASTSPFHLSRAGGTVLADQVEFADGERLSFIPDAAFSIRHAGRLPRARGVPPTHMFPSGARDLCDPHRPGGAAAQAGPGPEEPLRGSGLGAHDRPVLPPAAGLRRDQGPRRSFEPGTQGRSGLPPLLPRVSPVPGRQASTA